MCNGYSLEYLETIIRLLIGLNSVLCSVNEEAQRGEKDEKMAGQLSSQNIYQSFLINVSMAYGTP